MASSSSISSIPTVVLHDFLENFHSRRLLLQAPLYTSPPPVIAPSLQPTDKTNAFDVNIVMVLSVLLCALICSLGLNAVIRCVLRCSTSGYGGSSETNPSAKLANTGIEKKALKAFPIVSYTIDLKLPGSNTECSICLSDFVLGARVKVLPKCNHGFHVKCIDKWLNSHSSCPTCRHCLIETSKIVGCNQLLMTSEPGLVQPVASHDVVLRIGPLQQEGLVRNYET